MEILRRAVRGVLGYSSGLYRSAATFISFASTVSTDGISKWRMLKEIQEGKRGNNAARPITLKNLKHPILLRPGTSDVVTIINNVIREEYGQLRLDNEPRWMIDAGAYIGDTASYFLSKFQELNVIALEPNPESHEMAKLNLKPYGERVFLLKKGLHSSEEVQRFSGSQTGASIAASGIEIECTTVPFLLKQFSISHLDILKMDIEGAEEAVFSSSPEAWLGRIGLLMIEFHGHRAESAISRILKENNFLMKKYRSIWYCRRDNK